MSSLGCVSKLWWLLGMFPMAMQLVRLRHCERKLHLAELLLSVAHWYLKNWSLIWAEVFTCNSLCQFMWHLRAELPFCTNGVNYSHCLQICQWGIFVAVINSSWEVHVGLSGLVFSSRTRWNICILVMLIVWFNECYILINAAIFEFNSSM